MLYRDSTVYIIGHGKTGSNNAITEKFKIFFIGFVVDVETDKIVDLSCSATIDTTRNFIRSMFIGKKFDKYYMDLEEEIKRRYFGSSQRAIIISYKDALNKYEDVKRRYY